MISPDVERVQQRLRGLAAVANRVADTLAGEIVTAAELAAECVTGGGKLLFCGNGGSAADAQHLATEYVVRFGRDRAPLAAIALTTDTSLLTAAANDYGFEHVFARQVRALGDAGDVLFLHSTSGRSRNLLQAAEAAAEQGLHTVALLGGDGGALRDLVDHAIVVQTELSSHAQEMHLAIGHAICDLVEHRVASLRDGV